MSCLWMQWWPAYTHRRLFVLPPNWPIMKSKDNKVCLTPYLYEINKTVVFKSLVFIPTVPMIIPRPTAEALKHKINPSQNMTNPQSVDVLLYTPGQFKNSSLHTLFQAERLIILNKAMYNFELSICMLSKRRFSSGM